MVSSLLVKHHRVFSETSLPAPTCWDEENEVSIQPGPWCGGGHVISRMAEGAVTPKVQMSQTNLPATLSVGSSVEQDLVVFK